MPSSEPMNATYTVADIVTWQKAGSLRLSPSYQRRPVWQKGAKSYLIDTIVRALPMPVIFLRDIGPDVRSLSTTREVVDGQQRLRTILSFIGGESLTPDYDPEHDEFTVRRNHNASIAGRTFDELETHVQHSILDYRLSAHVFPQHVDDREILQIFARMNSTGLKLNYQELRNAHYFGYFKTTMYEVGSEQLSRWRDWNLFTEYNIARMDEVELTSELAQLILRGVSGRSQRALNALYGEKDDDFPEQEELSRRFRHVMESIDRQHGDEIPTSPFSRRTLFYPLFAAYYDLEYGLNSPLTKTRPSAISKSDADAIWAAGISIRDRTAPEPVLDAAGRRTTHISSRRTIVNYLRN